MATEKASMSTLLVILSISVCAGSSIVRNQDIFNTKQMQSQGLEMVIRKAIPVQSLPMLDLYHYNKAPVLTDLRLKNNSVCSCVGSQCGCCLHMEVESIGLNDTGCVNITYLSKEIGFEFTLSVDGIVLIDKKISVSNPPPLCAAIPYLKKLASACVQFSNLTFQDKRFSGCLSVEIVFAGEVLVNYKFGCFHIPPALGNRDFKFSDVKQMRIVDGQRLDQMRSLYSLHKSRGLHGIKDRQLQNNSICSCVGSQCGCCVHMEVEAVGLNDTGCVNITYLSKEIGFEFTLSVDGIVIIDKKISVSNPPPLCAAIPYLKKLASACVQFSNLTFQDKRFSGCVSVEIVFAGEVLVNYKFGCFHIPPALGNRDFTFFK